jgi:hypothetical protein
VTKLEYIYVAQGVKHGPFKVRWGIFAIIVFGPSLRSEIATFEGSEQADDYPN